MKFRGLLVAVFILLGIVTYGAQCGPRDLDNSSDMSYAPLAECLDGQTQTCDAGLKGICSNGIQTCQSGFFSACVQLNAPEAEIYDGLDNDCNGLVDDAGQIVVTTDELDGYLIRKQNAGGFIINTLVTDQTMKSDQTDYADHDYNLAVLALPLEPYSEINWGKVEGVSLKVYLLNYEEFKIPGSIQCPTSKITASVKASADLSALLSLPCECPSIVCVPSYCQISDSFGAEPGTLITLNDLGDGWFEINSPDFIDIMAAASSERDFLVISLQSTCTNNYYAGWKPIEIEDAGNHGSSNNLPTMEFLFLR